MTQKLIRTKKIHWLYYILSVVLVCSYCVILWRGLHPNIGSPYRLFYVDRRFDKYTELGYDIALGKTLSFDQNAEESVNGCGHLGRGEWVHWFDGYSTMAGTEASVYFIRTTEAALSASITIVGSDPVDLFVIQVDGQTAYSGPMIQGEQVFELPIPPGEEQGILSITFLLPEGLPGIAGLKELKLS